MNTTTRRSWLGALCALLFSTAAQATDRLITIDIRSGVTLSYWYMPRDNATATLVLLPGGAGGIGMRDGQPQSGNFLVRSRALFAAQHFNVAVVGRASDMQELDFKTRIGAAHVEDLHRLVDDLRARSSAPIWLVGTSRGTVSATAAAIAFGNDKLAGIALTASVTSFNRAGAVPTQALESIQIPVLVLHHQKDACPSCAPHEVPLILKGLTRTPVKKLLWASGGHDPRGDPCEAFHWHGFIGMEAQAVESIAQWIRKPTP